MSIQARGDLEQFRWTPQPEAAALVHSLVDAFCESCPVAAQLRQRMLAETGTRLIDWIDHLVLPSRPQLLEQLTRTGFTGTHEDEQGLWEHPHGLFPPIITNGLGSQRLAIKVDSIDEFLAAQRVGDDVLVEGTPGDPYCDARIAMQPEAEFLAVERHGYRGFEPLDVTAAQAAAAVRYLAAFRHRQRHFVTDHEGFDYALQLVRAANDEIGVDWACSLFFQAEREYWQSRNRAGQVQRIRQDELGLGWANHDHHTYRSSRENFVPLVAVLEELGFQCRERFYGGLEAGWGAQVLEQPTAGIVIFADVDLSTEEVSGDFAHEPLPERDQLGTVGLWCKLHGEAFLQAGMHHLECEFDFDAAREQLRAEGIETMPPFTDFPYLKQAFTVGERWRVDPLRIERALEQGLITAEQADHFRESGALGSHLEILQRDDGYKGFNQTGISEIIHKTDPRRQ